MRPIASWILAIDKRPVIEDDTYDSIYLNPPSYCSGGGGLVSTIPDYFRFCSMLLNGVASEGFGFGLVFSVHLGSNQSQAIGSKGIYA